MKDTRYTIRLLFAALALLLLGACSSPLEPTLPQESAAAPGFVRISIGAPENTAGMAQARTLQPKSDAVAGYQLSFEGGTHDPVNLSGGATYADVSLADGTWTITATAYRLGGVIGNGADVVASGNINIKVSGGAVSTAIPPIILKAIEGGAEGTFSYNITVEGGANGTLTLWNIDGHTKVGGFGSGGVLSLFSSVENTYNLAPGRYIAEAKLANLEGNVAFRRDVVEIWPGTISDFIFAPASEAYLDPAAQLAGSGAVLSETETKVDGVAVGTGIGSGASEAAPKTYTVSAANKRNVSIELKFGPVSLSASYSWAQNTGTVPGEAYTSGALPTDFSTNNVLWVKAVSEDGGAAVYYRFVVTSQQTPTNGSFTDTDYDFGQISGTISWTRPVSFTNVNGYRIYLGSSETEKLMSGQIYPDKVGVTNTTQEVEVDTELLPGAKYFLVYSYGTSGDFPECLAIPIVDLGAFGTFTVITDNKAGISYTAPNLVISQSGTYHITGTTTTDRIQVSGSNITANIVLNNVSLDVNAVVDAAAFDANVNNDTGVTVNLTLEGTNTLKSGQNKAGLRVPSNGTLTITETVTGSLTVTGGSNGAGIGSNNEENSGTITIAGGTVTATGGQYGAGIGSGRNGSSGTINITGGAVTADSHMGTGIGNGNGGTSDTITITGGTVNAHSPGSTGISADTVTIAHGVVNVEDCYLGIGGGEALAINDAVVIANSIKQTLTEGDNVNDAIVFIGNTWTLYGDFTLTNGVTVDAGQIFFITSGNRLTIPASVTLTNNGTIFIDDGGIIDGSISGNPPIYPAFVVESSSGYTYKRGILTIIGDGTYAISMKPGVPGTNSERIVVASGVNADITISGINIDMSAKTFSAFDMTDATVNLILAGDNVLKGGYNKAGLEAPAGSTLTVSGTGFLTATAFSSETAGIGGGYWDFGGTINITGGTVIANGGTGIGGYWGNGETVNITGGTVIATGSPAIGSETVTISGGTVTATGGQNGAGIDGSETVTISGGTVTATGGSNQAGIDGSGTVITISGGTVIATGRNGGIGGGTITAIKNAVVIASSIQPTLPAGDNLSDSLVFNGNTGILYGNAALTDDITINNGQILHIYGANRLEIPGEVTLNNAGEIVMTRENNITGTVSGNQPKFTPLTVSGDTTYSYLHQVLTILGDGNYIIGMRTETTGTADQIVVAPGVNADITLSGVKIDVSGTSGASAFYMTGAMVNLTLIGDNVLNSGFKKAGLDVPQGATLEITADSTGSLTAAGGSDSAGIGSGFEEVGGTISIAGGTITATGGMRGAGIGGSSSRNGGMISITGGIITASGGDNAAGIGGGAGGPTIGGGVNVGGGTISISGGTITATGGRQYGGAGIGSGVNANGGTTVDITGGTITAIGGDRSAGIGGGVNVGGGTISISGGTITATGNNGGAGIGIGDNGSGGTITMLNNAVVFASSISPTLTDGGNVNDAIVFIENAGTLYGNLTLANDVTIDAGKTLTIGSGKSLTIPGAVTLTNNGTINNEGTITGVIIGNQPVTP